MYDIIFRSDGFRFVRADLQSDRIEYKDLQSYHIKIMLKQQSPHVLL